MCSLVVNVCSFTKEQWLVCWVATYFLSEAKLIWRLWTPPEDCFFETLKVPPDVITVNSVISCGAHWTVALETWLRKALCLGHPRSIVGGSSFCRNAISLGMRNLEDTLIKNRYFHKLCIKLYKYVSLSATWYSIVMPSWMIWSTHLLLVFFGVIQNRDSSSRQNGARCLVPRHLTVCCGKSPFQEW
jgi:hypothetical protein